MVIVAFGWDRLFSEGSKLQRKSSKIIDSNNPIRSPYPPPRRPSLAPPSYSLSSYRQQANGLVGVGREKSVRALCKISITHRRIFVSVLKTNVSVFSYLCDINGEPSYTTTPDPIQPCRSKEIQQRGSSLREPFYSAGLGAAGATNPAETLLQSNYTIEVEGRDHNP